MARKVSKAVSAWFRKNGKRGGQARAKKLAPERRQEIARQAAQARWGSKTAVADVA